MKHLLTLGDSFTFGEELADCTQAWPYLLAGKINYNLTNLALPSKSNDYMLRMLVQVGHKYDLVVIAWSHFARIEFADEFGNYDIWPGSQGNLFSGEVSYRKDLIEYVNRHHSDEYLYTKYLQNIILAQRYLDAHTIPYVMLDAFGNTTSRNLNTVLTEQIDTEYFLGWPDESMMEWTYGTAQGPYGHFLNDGHKIVADKIHEHIRNLSWVS